MEQKIKDTENIKLLETALTLLKNNKEIISYSCNRSFSHEYGENINLNIEFEIPNDLSYDSESSFSCGSDSKYSTTSNTTNNDLKVYTSTITPSSESSTVSKSCKENDASKVNSNYQALNTISESKKNVYVEIIVYVRSYVQNKINEGILERIDIELNPYRGTPRDIIKSILPDKDPHKIMKDGMYFTRKDFDCNRDYNKQQNWITIHPYEIDMSLVKIYGSTSLDDFKMSFVVDDITRE